MSTATIGEYNVLFKNSQATVRGDVLQLMRACSVAGLNEGANGAPKRGIEEACRRQNWQGFYSGESDWLIWDPQVWRGKGKGYVRKICQSAKDLGMNVKYRPARMMVWKTLVHIESGRSHQFFVTHLPQGYAKPEGTFSDKTEWLADVQAKESTIRVDNITNRQIKRKSAAQFHHLLGDMNVRQANEQVPWYPTNLWDDNWVEDTLPKSIDWMMHSKVARKNGLRVEKRTTLGKEAGYDSDHRAGLKKVNWPSS